MERMPLHIVEKLPSYDRLHTVTGVALQMQRELLWFKEVEKIMEPSKRGIRKTETNMEGLSEKIMEPSQKGIRKTETNLERQTIRTGKEIFANENKQLLKDTQQWTKDTSSSSTFVAALLVTITFAAMFTIPGGNNDHRKSNFLENEVFLLFVVADAIALFSSSTSVFMFLSTLTHSSQEDFLSVLPLRLTLGLLSLFISLVTTMIAFSATLVLLLRDRYQWSAPVTAVSSILPVLFMWLQYPLLQELVAARFKRSIFRKQSSVLLQ